MGSQHELQPRFSPQAGSCSSCRHNGAAALQLASSDRAPALLVALGGVVLRAEGQLLKAMRDGEASVRSPQRSWQRGLCRVSCSGSDSGGAAPCPSRQQLCKEPSLGHRPPARSSSTRSSVPSPWHPLLGRLRFWPGRELATFPQCRCSQPGGSAGGCSGLLLHGCVPAPSAAQPKAWRRLCGRWRGTAC